MRNQSSLGLQAAINGTVDPTTVLVTTALLYGGAFYTQNTSGTWHTEPAAGGGVFATDPRIPGSGTVLGSAIATVADGATVATAGGIPFSWFNQGAATVNTLASGKVDIVQPGHSGQVNQVALQTQLPPANVGACATARISVSDPDSYYNTGLMARNQSTGAQLALKSIFANSGQSNFLSDAETSPTVNGNAVVPATSYAGFILNSVMFMRHCQDGLGNLNQLVSPTGLDNSWISITGGAIAASSVGSPDHIGPYEDANGAAGQTYNGVSHLLAFLMTAGYTPQAAAPGGDLTAGEIVVPSYPATDAPPTIANPTLSDGMTLAPAASYIASIAPQPFTASISANTLTVISPPAIPLAAGKWIYGAGVISNTIIYGPGTAANTWIINNDHVSAIASETMNTPELVVTSVGSGSVTPDQIVVNSHVMANTYVEMQDSGTTGGAGSYAINYSQTVTSQGMTAPAAVSKAHYDFTPTGNVNTRALLDQYFYHQNIFGNQSTMIGSDGIEGDISANWGSPRLYPPSNPFNNLNWTSIGLNSGVTCALNNTAAGCTHGNLLGVQLRSPVVMQKGDILRVKMQGGNSPVWYHAIALYGGVEHTQYPATYFQYSASALQYDSAGCYDEIDPFDGFRIDTAHPIGHSLKIGVVPINQYAANASGSCYAPGLQVPAILYAASGGTNFDWSEDVSFNQAFQPVHWVNYTDTYSAPHAYAMELLNDGSDRIKYFFDGHLVAIERYHQSPGNPGWSIHLEDQTAATFDPEGSAANAGITPDNPIAGGSMSATYTSLDVITGGVASISQPLDPNGVTPSDPYFITGVGDPIQSGINH